jgi:hypothetical protein
MNEYPLLFTFREMVDGGNFVAGVVCDGRALMVNAGEDGWHVSGVEPGGLSEIGATQYEAYSYFRQGFTHALRVFAEDAKDYPEFEKAVSRFFDRKDAEEEERWFAARSALRAGAELGDTPFKELPRETAEEKRCCLVKRLDFQPAPGDIRQVAGPPDEVGVPSSNRRAA